MLRAIRPTFVKSYLPASSRAQCASQAPLAMPLSTRGQAVTVTTASHVYGHKLVTVGELREFNKNCVAARIAKMRSPSSQTPTVSPITVRKVGDAPSKSRWASIYNSAVSYAGRKWFDSQLSIPRPNRYVPHFRQARNFTLLT